jgi:DNA polymerase-3 subunit delta
MQNIKTGNIAPVYFLFGEEIFFIEQALNRIVKLGTEPSTRDFNYDVLQGESVDWDMVGSLISSYPMMADRRVVVLKSVQRCSPSDKKKILAYVERPVESTCLVLTAGKVDRRQGFYTALCKHAQWVECKTLYENQAVEWIKTFIKKRGFTISHEGATLLVQQVGRSMWGLYNEAEKCLTFCWEKKNIGLNEVNAVVGFSRKYNTWEFTDCVGRRELESALTMLQRLLDEGQSPTGLIINVYQRIYLLLRIRKMFDKGMSRQEVIKLLNLRPYFTKLYLSQANKYSTGELEKAMQVLLRADFFIKIGYMKPDIIMTLVTHNLIRSTSGNWLLDNFWVWK